MVTFSVIVPTKGRRSLSTTLSGIAAQLEPGDELLVRCGRERDYGNSARQSMVERAIGTHLLFMDDDDLFARGAFATMRSFATEHSDRIGIFRMRLDHDRVIWTDPEVRVGNVSSQMLCIPNIPGKLGRWDHGRERSADYAFIVETVRLQGEPVFRPEIVALFDSAMRPVPKVLNRVARALAEARHQLALRGRARQARRLLKWR